LKGGKKGDKKKGTRRSGKRREDEDRKDADTDARFESIEVQMGRASFFEPGNEDKENKEEEIKAWGRVFRSKARESKGAIKIRTYLSKACTYQHRRGVTQKKGKTQEERRERKTGRLL